MNDTEQLPKAAEKTARSTLAGFQRPRMTHGRAGVAHSRTAHCNRPTGRNVLDSKTE
ncbi:hypothetical protein ACFRCI_04000 [Streptomyces sp. NPDC056638]|uniref:hypothetical protein n=1 Tax=Streptomyces sp. NPDC056638 TaxID=3345887 RepID=UPI0036864C1F